MGKYIRLGTILNNVMDNQYANASVNGHGNQEEYDFWGRVFDYIKDFPSVSLDDTPSWIRVSETLPRVSVFTLILTKGRHVGISYFVNGWWGGYDRDGITHWMPLPDLPEKEDQC